MARTKSVNELKREFHEVATERFVEIASRCSTALSLLLEAEQHINDMEDHAFMTHQAGIIELTRALLDSLQAAKLPTYWNLKPSKKESPDV